MFVQMRPKTHGVVALLTSGLALGACSDPTANTDLRFEGDPEVLSVLILNDPDGIIETATFCKLNDAKRPGPVGNPFNEISQVCPESLAEGVEIVEDAPPTSWHARIMFDELLNPDIEDLIPILDPMSMVPTGQFNGSLAATQPAELFCGLTAETRVAVGYDGYYVPNGNAFTYPLGPSLVILPVDASDIAAGSTCTVALKDNVVDKDGNVVPEDQRGAYEFLVAPLEQLDASIAEKTKDVAVTAALALDFNGFVQVATLDPTEVDIMEGAIALDGDGNVTAAACAAAATPHVAKVAAVMGSSTGLKISLNDPVVAANAWDPGRLYVVTINDGAEVADKAGGTADVGGFKVCFATKAATLAP
jgi:hypothetical protein